MSERDIFEGLNPQQLQAVRTTRGPLLVLAGAGSGKTRTLTSRIAYLIREQGVDPRHILAITFTNKAAKEMRERLRGLVGDVVDSMDVATFHAECVKILRRNIEHLPGYTRWFSIYDEDDTRAVIKQCLTALNMSDTYYPPRSMLAFISSCKNQLKSPEEAAAAMANRDQNAAMMCKLYHAYEEKLHAANALDFDDLLIRTLELFVQCPDVLGYYQSRFQYIHVDEYQDTNGVQYQLVKILAAAWGNLCVVGDDDQSIYAWRGADIRNILDFEKDFPGATVIRLEQNYRSTVRILDAANAVIAHNLGRKQKRLWSDRGEGELVVSREAHTDREEAQYVTATIASLLGEYSLGEIAILYRMNSQSRVLEEALMQAGFAYRMVGGTRFYDRKEIRDLTAYLRLIANPSDDVSFARVLNVPRRGIGETTLATLRSRGEEERRSMMSLLEDADALNQWVPRAAGKLRAFAGMLGGLVEAREGLSLSQWVDQVAHDTGLWDLYALDESDEAQGRMENLGDYISAVRQFELDHPEATLEDFLEHVALQSDLDRLDENGGVTLMTIHSAKGLEFPVVFVVGMEEGIFPHQRALIDPTMTQMEEERRLCYVAITRAMRRLYLTHCHQRMIFGSVQYNPPSRFLGEIPPELLEVQGAPELPREEPRAWGRPAKPPRPPINLGGPVIKPAASAAKKEPVEGLGPGTRVEHPTFGVGTVISAAGMPGRRTLTIAFEGKGVKNLSEAMAPLKRRE